PRACYLSLHAALPIFSRITWLISSNNVRSRDVVTLTIQVLGVAGSGDRLQFCSQYGSWHHPIHDVVLESSGTFKILHFKHRFRIDRKSTRLNSSHVKI